MSQKLMEIPDIKLIQLQYESDTWKRLLEFMQNENIHFKYLLSDVVKINLDKQVLEQLEDFQNNFIMDDDLISVLRNEIVELNKLLEAEKVNGGDIKEKIEIKMKSIRQTINHAEKQFSLLKLAFISFLSENI